MKLFRVIFIATILYIGYSSNKESAIKDGSTPYTYKKPEVSVPIQADPTTSVTRGVKITPEFDTLEAVWDPNYIHYDPTYRRHTGDDELDGYFED